MNSTQYSILTYVLLGLVSLFCISYSLKYDKSIGLINLTFFIIIVYAVSGVLRSTNRNNYFLLKYHKFALFLIASVALPCFITEVWIKNEIASPTLAFSHLFFGVTLALVEIISTGVDRQLFDVIIGFNVLILLVLSIMYADFFSVCCSLLFIMAYFGCGQNVSPQTPLFEEETYNMCITAFTFCAFLALKSY